MLDKKAEELYFIIIVIKIMTELGVLNMDLK